MDATSRDLSPRSQREVNPDFGPEDIQRLADASGQLGLVREPPPHAQGSRPHSRLEPGAGQAQQRASRSSPLPDLGEEGEHQRTTRWPGCEEEPRQGEHQEDQGTAPSGMGCSSRRPREQQSWSRSFEERPEVQGQRQRQGNRVDSPPVVTNEQIAQKLDVLSSNVLALTDSVSTLSTSMQATFQAMKADFQQLVTLVSPRDEHSSTPMQAQPQVPRVEVPPEPLRSVPTTNIVPGRASTRCPKVEEFPKFNGHYKSDHREFLEKIDLLKASYGLPEAEIISKLPSLLTESAFDWYFEQYRIAPLASWEEWKEGIETEFNTELWRDYQQSRLDTYRWRTAEKDPQVWIRKFVRMYRSLDPEITDDRLYSKIRNAIPTDARGLLHIACSSSRDQSLVDIRREFLALATSHTSNSSGGQSKERPREPPRDVIRKDARAQGPRDFPSGDNGTTGATYQGSPQNRPAQYSSRPPWQPTAPNRFNGAKIQALEAEEPQSPETQDDDCPPSERTAEEAEDCETYEIFALGCDVEAPQTSLTAYKGHRHIPVDVSLAQAEAVMTKSAVLDASPVIRMPEQGQAHLLGITTTTVAIICDQPHTILIDTGAACSVIGETFLAQLDPDFKAKLTPTLLPAVVAFGSRIEPIGLYAMDVVFPHPKESVEIRVELLVVSTRQAPASMLIGFEWIAIYGIDLIASKGRFMTIGASTSKFALRDLRTKSEWGDVRRIHSAEIFEVDPEFSKAISLSKRNPT